MTIYLWYILLCVNKQGNLAYFIKAGLHFIQTSFIYVFLPRATNLLPFFWIKTLARGCRVSVKILEYKTFCKNFKTIVDQSVLINDLLSTSMLYTCMLRWVRDWGRLAGCRRTTFFTRQGRRFPMARGRRVGMTLLHITTHSICRKTCICKMSTRKLKHCLKLYSFLLFYR